MPRKPIAEMMSSADRTGAEGQSHSHQTSFLLDEVTEAMRRVQGIAYKIN
jgi:hypothetical protein